MCQPTKLSLIRAKSMIFPQLKRSLSHRINADDPDVRGYKYDTEANIEQLLEKTSRSMLSASEIDGFKSKGFSSWGTQFPGSSRDVIDFFKSRKAPEMNRMKSLKDALSKPKASLKRTTEKVSSMLRGKFPMSARKQPPKPAPSATQRQAEMGKQKQLKKQQQHSLPRQQKSFQQPAKSAKSLQQQQQKQHHQLSSQSSRDQTQQPDAET